MAPRKGPAFRRVDTPRNVNKVVQLYKLGERERKTFAVCSPRPWGYATHWDPKEERTRPCQAAMGACPYCNNPKISTRDKAVILVANAVGQLHGFLELTPSAFKRLVELGEGLQGLRGLLIDVYRKGGHKKGELLVEPIGRYQHTTPLPDDRDPEPTLLRIFGLDKPA